jgi:hypothetical protein
LRRLVILGAVMLAMLTVLAVPAMAQNFNRNFNNGFFPNNFNNGFFPNNFNNNGNFVANDVSNESESGDVTPSFSVESTGNNSNQCVTPLQFGNTGNLNNSQGFLQYASGSGNLEAEGPTFDFAPVLNGGCNQQVQQSSAASSQY